MATEKMDLKQEAVWCLSNATSQATPEQIKALVDKGALQAIGSVLDSNDPRSLVVCLEGINFILKAGKEKMPFENGSNPMVTAAMMTGIVDKIEQL